MSVSPAEALCIDCNLCCNGAIFPSVMIDQDEESRVAPFLNLRDGEGLGLRQPQGCTQLGTDGMCGCYADRPAACRRFKCDLLQNVELGMTNQADAVNTVAQANRLNTLTVAAFRNACPPEAWDDTIVGTLRASLVYMNAIDGDGFASMEEQTAFFWVVYRRYIRSHFKADFGDYVD